MIVDIETDAVILLGHGSRERAAVEAFERFVAFFKKWSGLRQVSPAYLELADPSIPAAIDRAVSKGAARIRAYPLFLFPGRHLLEDLPRLLSEGRKRHPGIEIYFVEGLGSHPKLLELAKIRIDPAKEKSHPAETALLVIGQGTTEPKGLAAVEAFAERLKPLLPYPHAVPCFVESTSPSIPEGIGRCIALGAKSVVAFPCLLFTGVTWRRIQEQIQAMRDRHPGLPIRLADPFGIDPLLAEIVWEGVKNAGPIAGEGEAEVN